MKPIISATKNAKYEPYYFNEVFKPIEETTLNKNVNSVDSNQNNSLVHRVENIYHTDQTISKKSDKSVIDEKEQLQQQVNETDAAVQQAEKATATAQQTIALLTQQLQEKPSAFWQDKMVLGSILGFAGLLFGLVVPSLIPGRRRKERWM